MDNIVSAEDFLNYCYKNESLKSIPDIMTEFAKFNVEKFKKSIENFDYKDFSETSCRNNLMTGFEKVPFKIGFEEGFNKVVELIRQYD